MPIHLLLKCSDLEKAKPFYQDILAFDVVEDKQSQICTVSKDDCTLILSASDIWPGEPGLTGTCYLFIDDVKTYYQTIKHRVDVLWPLQMMDYGTEEFGIKAFDGYTLAFAQKGP